MKLPTYAECVTAIQKGNATPLEKFIYHNEPAGIKDEKIFRRQLKDMITFIKKIGEGKP